MGCDFGSTTAKAVCLSPDKELLFSCYALSKGNPIEDARSLFRQLREVIGDGEILGLGITGYGKDLLKGILGADCGVVETIAHASAGLHYFPDADCICDVGGVDVKIMILKNGAVSDFRLNSQCSSGNGAFLQGVAERFGIPLSEIAEGAFLAQSMPQLSMGCGVFLQSDIVNQQRKGWQAEEILAALCSILPLNVWIYAGGMNNLAQVGKKYILQGGTHKNLAVVKTQVDFIRSKVPDAEVVVHPYSGEAGAIGAALVSLDWWEKGGKSQFRGFDVIDTLTYTTTTSKETVCNWCPVTCQRSFIDVALPGGQGREWSKVPISKGWERVIVNNSCPKGLVEDLNEMKVIKAGIEKNKNAFPNIADMVRQRSLPPQHPSPPKDRSEVRVGIPKVLNVWSTHQFWVGFLREIGISSENIVFSSDTSEEQGREFGKGRGTVDCCYPVKAMSGHYGELIFGQKKKLNVILSPMIYSLPSFLRGHVGETLACTRVMAGPENISAGFMKESDVFADNGIKYASPFREHGRTGRGSEANVRLLERCFRPELWRKRSAPWRRDTGTCAHSTKKCATHREKS